MPVVYNPTAEVVKVQAFGNHFSFNPGQMKVMQPEIAQFLSIDKAYLGFVTLPEEVLEDKTAPESVRLIDEAKKMGVNNRINHLKRIISNLEVSLRRDLEQSNIKTDPLKYASEGELAAYRELAKYKFSQEDEGKKRMEEIEELKKTIGSEE